MSEFKSSLLALLNAQDAHIVIDGYEIDTIAEEGPQRVRCDCGEESICYLDEQEVTVSDGECIAMSATVNEDREPAQTVLIRITVPRPITQEDLLPA